MVPQEKKREQAATTTTKVDILQMKMTKVMKKAHLKKKKTRKMLSSKTKAKVKLRQSQVLHLSQWNDRPP